MDCLRRRARLVSVHTEILFDDDGILEIYHVGRKATNTGKILGEGAPCIHIRPLLYKCLGQVTVSHLSSRQGRGESLIDNGSIRHRQI
jgi:hypothetical protein